MPDLEWMAWTSATAVFVAAVFIGLGLLTALAVARPSTPRKGLLPMPTARGDRIYASLLGTGLILIVLLATTSQPLSVGLGLAVIWTVVILGWG
jgi:predicted small integral membrane protein